MGVSAIIIGFLLKDFSNLRLIQVIQGTAVVTLLLNLLALWKQESLSPMTKEERLAPRPSFKKAWTDFNSVGSIGNGLCVFVGVTHSDTEKTVERLAKKLLHLRIFEDSSGKMNLSTQ